MDVVDIRMLFRLEMEIFIGKGRRRKMMIKKRRKRRVKKGKGLVICQRLSLKIDLVVDLKKRKGLMILIRKIKMGRLCLFMP
jgi:hypothetical protein